MQRPGYCFTKGLTQNLLTNLKLKYKIPQLYLTELKIISLVPILLNYIVYSFYIISDLKFNKLGNDCVTLHFA